MQIPQHATSDIQSLDRYFKQQLKNFVKALYHHVALDEIDYNLYERNNTIPLVCPVYNQLGTPVFQRMIMYSWFAADFTKSYPNPFIKASTKSVSFTRRHASLVKALNIQKVSLLPVYTEKCLLSTFFPRLPLFELKEGSE